MIHVNGTKRSCVYTLCATRPCHRGTCMAQSPSKFTCHCPEGYRGRHCETTLAIYREDVGLSFSSLFAICICFMALLGRLSTTINQCDTHRSFGTCGCYLNKNKICSCVQGHLVWLWSVQIFYICMKINLIRRNVHSTEMQRKLKTNCQF